MDALRSFGDHILKAFKFPKPYNWGYPVFYGALGFITSYFLLKLLFSGTFMFSSTSLIGCAIIVIFLVMFAFVAPSVIIAEKCGLYITGRYTGIGAFFPQSFFGFVAQVRRFGSISGCLLLCR